MDDVVKVVAISVVSIPAATIINLVLGFLACVVCYFLFKTVWKNWLEQRVVSFAKEIKEEAKQSGNVQTD